MYSETDLINELRKKLMKKTPVAHVTSLSDLTLKDINYEMARQHQKAKYYASTDDDLNLEIALKRYEVLSEEAEFRQFYAERIKESCQISLFD